MKKSEIGQISHEAVGKEVESSFVIIHADSPVDIQAVGFFFTLVIGVKKEESMFGFNEDCGDETVGGLLL